MDLTILVKTPLIYTQTLYPIFKTSVCNGDNRSCSLSNPIYVDAISSDGVEGMVNHNYIDINMSM